jgi:hypothetical protein
VTSIGQYVPGNPETRERTGCACRTLSPASTPGHSRALRLGDRGSVAVTECLQIAMSRRRRGTPSLIRTGQRTYPFCTRRPRGGVATPRKVPANDPKADARTRTGDPFITSEFERAGPGRPRVDTAARHPPAASIARWRAMAAARGLSPASACGRGAQSARRRTLKRGLKLARPKRWRGSEQGRLHGRLHRSCAVLYRRTENPA